MENLDVWGACERQFAWHRALEGKAGRPEHGSFRYNQPFLLPHRSNGRAFRVDGSRGAVTHELENGRLNLFTNVCNPGGDRKEQSEQILNNFVFGLSF
jgi:hypothetical protein